jgi:murein L,D-transpeptidase YcbB/YkuD
LPEADLEERSRQRVRPSRLLGGRLAAALVLSCLGACGGHHAMPATGAVSVPSAVEAESRGSEPWLVSFYAAHHGQPLWIAESSVKPEAAALIAAIDQAGEDGLDPKRYAPEQLRAAVAAAAQGKPAALAHAELLLSRAFVAYVTDLHRPAPENMPFLVDAALSPMAPDPRRLLEGAAAASSLGAYMASAERMNPLYQSLRTALASGTEHDPQRLRLIRLNLDRARALPPEPGRRFILVDIAAQKLQLFEDGQVHDEMKVIVGKPDMQTPILSGLIRFASLNPYWNIPPDLVRDKIAPRMLAGDKDYLKREHLEVLSDFTDNATLLDPDQVDWSSVAAGVFPLRVRQLPGLDNMMGAVKFMLPNRLGIYLHDTPDKYLFANADRRRSSGCVRLQDAARLGKWLFGHPLPAPGGQPEQRIDLPAPVPVYITYLTAAPKPGGGIAFQNDGYGRDKVLLARL